MDDYKRKDPLSWLFVALNTRSKAIKRSKNIMSSVKKGYIA